MSGLTNEVPRFAVEGDKIFDYQHNRYLEAHGELEDGETTWHLPLLRELILAGKQTHEARTVPPSPQTQALIEQLSERAEAAEAALLEKDQELQDALAARDDALGEMAAIRKAMPAPPDVATKAAVAGESIAKDWPVDEPVLTPEQPKE